MTPGVHYAPATLAGRCANGHENGRGRVVHAIAIAPMDAAVSDAFAAVCGVTYGKRSAGWASAAPGVAITCAKCLRLTAASKAKPGKPGKPPKRKKEFQLQLEFLPPGK